MKKVFLAGIFHESHSFTDDITGPDDFKVFRGEGLLERQGDGSLIDGFLTEADRQSWHVIPGTYYSAMPSGAVDHAVFEAFWKELQPVLTKAIHDGLDAIFLPLHGAMVTIEEPDPEGELLRRIRAVPGAENLPLFAVFDLHGNLSSAMAQHADVLVCYQENPHTDAFERAVETTRLLARCFETGVKPQTRARPAPIILPPISTGTADEPMKTLEDMARTIESKGSGILAVSVWGGYSFADVYDAGLAFSIVTEEEPAVADAELDKLVEMAWELRDTSLVTEEDLDEVLARIVPVQHGPVILVESADNIGGGAPGDCTDVLRALVRHDIAGAGVVMADPEAVQALQAISPGQHATLPIGGKGSALDPGPVELKVELVSRSDGRFTLEDRNSHLASVSGINIDMGPSAVVRHRGITILLNSRKTPPFDLGQWRSQGIHPENLKVIGVKAAVGHRRAYDPISVATYAVRTRGPCASDPNLLPYQHLRRPIFPLDSMETPDD